MENLAIQPKASKAAETKKDDEDDDVKSLRMETEVDAQQLDASTLLRKYDKDF